VGGVGAGIPVLHHYADGHKGAHFEYN
jgi:hypothetical protein